MVYEKIAKHFDETRVAYWKSVKEFLEGLEKGCVVLDCGCGNGKYSSLRRDLVFVSLDVTWELLEIASAKGKRNSDFIWGSCCSLPLRDKCVDVSICVAVLHHVEGFDRRVAVVRELLRCSRGGVLLTVWAREQEIKKGWQERKTGSNDFFIPWLDKYTGVRYNRMYHLFAREEVDLLVQAVGGCVKEIRYECNNWVIFLQQR